MTIIETKECNKCKTILPSTPEYFDRDKNCKDGLSRTCKQCMKEYNIKRYIKQKDKLKVQTRTYYENNKEKVKKLFEKNSREYYAKHKERYKKNHDKYREEHKEYYSEYAKIYCKENREKLIEIAQRRRARMSNLEATLTVEQWEYIKMIFNNCCAYCGKTEEEQLKENGKKLEQEHFIPVVNGGDYTIYNIIPACRSCNASKHDADFFDWYPNYKYYNENRQAFILDHLEYIEDDWEDYLEYKSGT